MITLALVDDHAVTRKGIKIIVEKQQALKVVLEASNGKDLLNALQQAEKLPDIAILDIAMPVMDGVATLDMLQSDYPTIKIIIFSILQEEDTIINMIRHGACAFLPKSMDPADLEKAIITVHTRGFFLSNLVKKQFFGATPTGRKKAGFTGKHFLSAKEVDFIKFSATDLTYPEIAAKMNVRPKTVENYRDSLFTKLDIKNRSSLVLYGIRNGLISLLP